MKTSADYPPALSERHKTTKADILLWLETMHDDSQRWVYAKYQKHKKRVGGKTGGRKK